MLARRPTELPSGQDVQVEMGDRFSTIFSVIDHHPETVLAQSFLLRNQRDPGQEMPEEFLVPGLRLPNPDDHFFRNEQEMDRGLGSDIAKAERELVLVDNITRYFAVGNLLEDCFFGTHDSREKKR